MGFEERQIERRGHAGICSARKQSRYRLSELVKKLKIDCDFYHVDGYLFFSPDDDADILEKEHDAASKAGIEVEIVTKAPIEDFNTGPCLRFPKQAQFHIIKYLDGVLQKAQNHDYISEEISTFIN